MSVIIGHASGDENGGAHGGLAGDQTGREVCTRSWYKGGWDVVLRPKSASVAEKSAQFCEQACANDNIGYDQNERNTLRAAARSAGWNAAAINVPCETDCSQLMTTCAEAARVDFSWWYVATSNAPTTWSMRNAFFRTGAYDVLLDRKYTDSSDYLLRGDILVRTSGHTAMALSNGDKATPRDESALSPFGGESENLEDDMDISKLTDEQCYQIVEKAQRHAATLPLPETWDAAGELREAVELGFTDGSRPMCLATRLEAAVMDKRTIIRTK